MKTRITVVPLGPGAPDLMTVQSMNVLKSGHKVILRTEKHPAAGFLSDLGVSYHSLDSFYEKYDNFDKMHQAMADYLWSEAKQKPLVFGVMDPERDGAVRCLKESRFEDAELIVLPGLSTLDLCQAGLNSNQCENGGIRVFTATDFLSAFTDPSLSLWILELDTPLLAGEVKLKLADIYGDEQNIFFFPPSEKESRNCVSIPVYRLDSQKSFNQTAALFVPAVSFQNRDRFSFSDLENIVDHLRSADGCPWDRIQTHESLTPYMVEEAWEVVSAINDHDPDHLADELGDVLFQVFIHTSIGQSCGEFSMTDVLSHICRKMILRHPHVFQQTNESTAEEIASGWERIKRSETGSKTVGDTLDDVSPSLPSLKYAIKVYKKLAQVSALRRNPSEISEEIKVHASALMGNNCFSEEHMTALLLKCTELCYQMNQDAEILLHHGTDLLKQKWQKAEKKMIQEELNPENLTYQQLRLYLEQAEKE